MSKFKNNLESLIYASRDIEEKQSEFLSPKEKKQLKEYK